MTTIPAPPPQPSSTAATITPFRALVVVDPHPDTARLPIGAVLKGHVIDSAPKGLVHIQTDAGSLVGKSALPLPEGTDVTLFLQARTPRLHLQITGINGQSPQLPPPPSTSRATPGEAVTIGPRTSDASVIRPDRPGPATPTAAQSPPLAPGARATATLLQPAEWASGTVNAHNRTGAPGNTGPVTVLPEGSRLPVRVTAVLSPADGSNGAAGAPSLAGSPTMMIGQTLRASVVTSTPNGRPLLGTPAGALALDAISALPRGSSVWLEIIGSPTLSLTTTGNSGTPPIPCLDPAVAHWPAFGAALELLKGSNPDAARHVMDTALPRLDTGLTSQTLFFLRALGRGAMDDWLGKASAHALQAANPALHSQLAEEFRQMGHTAGENEANDWRVLSVPLSCGAEIEPVRLLIRRNGAKHKCGATSGSSTRFVVEMNLSQLGRIQFDGLVRRDGKQLDLVVRSDPPLPRILHQSIRALFTRSTETAGLAGEVGFQAAPPEFINVAAEYAASSHNGMIV